MSESQQRQKEIVTMVQSREIPAAVQTVLDLVLLASNQKAGSGVCVAGSSPGRHDIMFAACAGTLSGEEFAKHGDLAQHLALLGGVPVGSEIDQSGVIVTASGQAIAAAGLEGIGYNRYVAVLMGLLIGWIEQAEAEALAKGCGDLPLLRLVRIVSGCMLYPEAG
jgi:hypothetical protein